MFEFFDCLAGEEASKQTELLGAGYNIIDCYPVPCQAVPGYFLVFKCVKMDIL